MAQQRPESTAPTGAQGKPEGRTLTIVGFVLAVVAVFVVPIVVGPIAAVLGGIAMRKGDPLGKWALAAGIAGTVIGIGIGLIWLSQRDVGG